MTHRHATTHPAMHPYVFHARGRRLIRRIVRLVFDRFLLLPIGAIIALIWANTHPESYFLFAHRLSFVINEIGMAFFFALLGQEVVEATMPGGALHSWRRWSMPVVAAAGGVVGALAVYLLYIRLNFESALAPAWPIACAIDAAAAYYVLKMIMPRSGALPFAVLLAIATDVFGLIIVAPNHLVLHARVGGVALLLGALLLAGLMRALNVRRFWPYLTICGPMCWTAFYWEGLHPAFALLPIVPFLPHEPRKLDLFADPPDDDAVHHAEHEWNLLVQLIVFLFALVNAGVTIREYGTGSWAMLTAALVGRPLGILTAVGLGVAAGLHLPRHLGWRALLVVALATSSGFSIALFFATGLLATGPLLAEIKVGVLGSVSGALLAIETARLLKVGKYAR